MSIERSFIRIADEKRTIWVDSNDEETALDLWKLVRQDAGETIDNSPAIQHEPMDLDLLEHAQYYKHGGKEVMYWVLEPLLPT
jgi:hypothetical protein